MTNRRIALLPVPGRQEAPLCISTDFSRRILAKMPLLRKSFARTPLFFQKRKKSLSSSHVNIKNDTRIHYDNRRFHTVSEFVSTAFSRHIAQHASAHTQKMVFNVAGSTLQNRYTANSHNHTQTFWVNNVHPHVHASASPVTATAPAERFFVKTHRHGGHTHSEVEHRRVERAEPSLSKAFEPEKLVYKSVKKLKQLTEETRRRQVQKSEERTVSQRLNVSNTLTKEERIQQSRELEAVSEKVYALVMKKYDRERRRRGDLYGR